MLRGNQRLKYYRKLDYEVSLLTANVLELPGRLKDNNAFVTAQLSSA